MMIGVRFGLAASSATLGIALGLFGAAGCGTGDCSCERQPIAEGTYRVTYLGSSPPEDPMPFDARGSTLTIGPDVVAIDYSRGGARITARYRITGKFSP